jgi:HK97 gp10 family phage protein
LDKNGIAALEAEVLRFRNEVLEEIAADARRYAPVDTGQLVASIEVDRAQGRVVAGADHATYVELGTRHMQPQPFLRPALYQKRGRGGE